MALHSQPQVACTSSGGPCVCRPLGLCPEMPPISPFLHVKVLPGLQASGNPPSTCLQSLPQGMPGFPRTPLAPPWGLANCLLVCASQRALRGLG